MGPAKLFRPTVMSAAIVSAIAVSQGAMAQQPVMEEVVITGYASSVLDAIDAKRNSDVVAEMIDAGDLSSLPDMSVAESLGRLPGVTVVRSSGQGSALNIRGMNGGLVFTTLNGREQTSTGTGEVPTRWTSFDIYPTELIQQAAVYKAPKASLIEGGVAGTVELKTINPLESQDAQHVFNVGARFGQNDIADDIGGDSNAFRGTFSYSGKLLDDRLGLVFGYTSLDQPNVSSFTSAGKPNVGQAEGTGYREFAIGGDVGSDERDSFLASVIFDVNSDMTVRADYFNSQLDSVEYSNTISVEHRGGDIVNPVLCENSMIICGGVLDITNTGGGNWAELRSFNNTYESEAETFGLNLEWRLTDRLSMTADYNHSESYANRDGLKVAFRASDPAAPAGDGASYDSFATLPGYAAFSTRRGGYTDLYGTAIEALDPAAGNLEVHGIEKYPKLKTDELDAFSVDFKYELENDPVFSSIEFGFRRSERQWSGTDPTYVWGNGIDQGAVSNATYPNMPVEPIAMAGLAGYSVAQLAGDFAGRGSLITIDNQQVFLNSALGAGNHEALRTWRYNWTMINSSTVNEDVDAAYFMANIDSEIAGVSVTGNMGVRVVKTDQYGTGVYNVPYESSLVDDTGTEAQGYDELTVGQEYTDVLPSINLNFGVTENDVLRLGYAEVMSRPPVEDIRPGSGYWCDTVENGWTGGSCDPSDPSNADSTVRYNAWARGGPGTIRPFYAQQIDISYEHYFENGGAVSVAYFYKDIESLIEKKVYFPPFNSYDLMISDGIPVPAGVTVGGQYETSTNNERGGSISGYELAYTDLFDDVLFMDQLGYAFSYSNTESETSVDGGANFGNANMPLPGLSKDVVSATIWGEVGDFNLRVSSRYRSSFLNEGVAPGGREYAYTDDYLVTDVQLTYTTDFGLEVLLQANNISDEPDVSYYEGESGGTVRHFGTQYFLGFNYRFEM